MKRFTRKFDWMFFKGRSAVLVNLYCLVVVVVVGGRWVLHAVITVMNGPIFLYGFRK